MLERQWLLEYPGVSFAWGGRDPVNNPFRLPRGVFNSAAPAWGEAAVTTEDADRPRDDGVLFGQDWRGGMTATFELGMAGTTEMHARQLQAEAQRAWRGDSIRGVPGAVAALTTQVGGQLRTVYGRPRKFTPGPVVPQTCRASATATFDCVTDVWYGPEQTVRIDLPTAPAGGGLTFPFTWPAVFAGSAEAGGGVTVAGTLPSPVVAELYGPISNPALRMTGLWTLPLTTSIPAGQMVTLDSRPWRQTILRGDGASLAGFLSRTARLSTAVMPPGSYEAALIGSDPTGTAYALVRWQNAYAGLS